MPLLPSSYNQETNPKRLICPKSQHWYIGKAWSQILALWFQSPYPQPLGNTASHEGEGKGGGKWAPSQNSIWKMGLQIKQIIKR